MSIKIMILTLLLVTSILHCDESKETMLDANDIKQQAEIINQSIEYIIATMTIALKKLHNILQQYDNVIDLDKDLKNLNPRQRKALQLFTDTNIITSKDIGNLFACQPRTCAKICADWVTAGFLEIVDASNKARSYKLAVKYQKFVK